MNTPLDIVQTILFIAGTATVLFYTHYLIRRGWLEGENATVKRRKVCDACFRDLAKVKKAMETLGNEPSEIV